MNDDASMQLREAVAHIRDTRRETDVMIPSMSSAREWMALGPLHERDFVLVPSAMGHATSVGLGLALAQPDRRTIVLSGDGSLMMNLGTLITIAAEAPRNLVVVVFVNGVYEVTGGQRTPGTAGVIAKTDRVDFAAIARGAGMHAVHEWRTIESLRANWLKTLDAEGPTLVVLHVAPVPNAAGPRSPGPAAARAQRFREALRH